MFYRKPPSFKPFLKIIGYSSVMLFLFGIISFSGHRPFQSKKQSQDVAEKNKPAQNESLEEINPNEKEDVSTPDTMEEKDVAQPPPKNKNKENKSFLSQIFAVFSSENRRNISSEKNIKVSPKKEAKSELPIEIEENSEPQEIAKKSAKEENEEEMMSRAGYKLRGKNSIFDRTIETLYSYTMEAQDFSREKELMDQRVIDAFAKMDQARLGEKKKFHARQNFKVQNMRLFKDPKFPHLVCWIIKGEKRLSRDDLKEDEVSTAYIMSYFRQVKQNSKNPFGFVLTGVDEIRDEEKAQIIWEHSVVPMCDEMILPLPKP